ncbi:MAG TPA: hypothetical protein VGA88_12095 [Burkholderiales bacterium]
MKAIDTLTNAVGLYALTLDGELGVFGNGNQFTVNHELSQAFGPQIRQLLKSYLANPDGGEYRLGVVFHGEAAGPWRSDTLVLEEHVLRETYPVGGPPSQALTAFQRKNRIKSIYRGIELLVEHRVEHLADTPTYCPVLFDRETSLDEYVPKTKGSATADQPVPVLEVLNLLAVLPAGRRNTPAVATMTQDMRRYLDSKAARRDGTFTLRKENYVRTKVDDSVTVEFFDVDKRHDRAQTLLNGDLGRRPDVAVDIPSIERFDQIERWLVRPHQPVDAALLRSFVRFRNLDADRLVALAEKALVHTAPGGVRLLDVGMRDAWNMFLLEGTVSLQAADGGSLLVTGGTDKAASPIAFLKPRKYMVTSITPVSFLWMHDAMLAAVAAAPDPDPKPASALKQLRS